MEFFVNLLAIYLRIMGVRNWKINKKSMALDKRWSARWVWMRAPPFGVGSRSYIYTMMMPNVNYISKCCGLQSGDTWLRRKNINSQQRAIQRVIFVFYRFIVDTLEQNDFCFNFIWLVYSELHSIFIYLPLAYKKMAHRTKKKTSSDVVLFVRMRSSRRMSSKIR